MFLSLEYFLKGYGEPYYSQSSWTPNDLLQVCHGELTYGWNLASLLPLSRKPRGSCAVLGRSAECWKQIILRSLWTCRWGNEWLFVSTYLRSELCCRAIASMMWPPLQPMWWCTPKHRRWSSLTTFSTENITLGFSEGIFCVKKRMCQINKSNTVAIGRYLYMHFIIA